MPGVVETDFQAQEQLLCEPVSVDDMNLAEGEGRTVVVV